MDALCLRVERRMLPGKRDPGLQRDCLVLDVLIGEQHTTIDLTTAWRPYGNRFRIRKLSALRATMPTSVQVDQHTVRNRTFYVIRSDDLRYWSEQVEELLLRETVLTR